MRKTEVPLLCKWISPLGRKPSQNVQNWTQTHEVAQKDCAEPRFRRPPGSIEAPRRQGARGVVGLGGCGPGWMGGVHACIPSGVFPIFGLFVTATQVAVAVNRHRCGILVHIPLRQQTGKFAGLVCAWWCCTLEFAVVRRMRYRFWMTIETDLHWSGDEYAQPEADYSGDTNVRRVRKRSGKPSPAAKAAQMLRWRARNRSHYREYQRLRMAAARLARRQEAESEED